MWEPKRILLTTDFSEPAREAVGHACSLAEKFAAELHVLHVVEDFFASLPEYQLAMYPEDAFEYAMSEATRLLAEIPDPQWSAGRTVVRAVEKGRAYEEIVRYADEHQVALIVIATHGRTGLRHLIMGSVAERVVRGVPCPVLTVRPRPAAGASGE